MCHQMICVCPCQMTCLASVTSAKLVAPTVPLWLVRPQDKDSLLIRLRPLSATRVTQEDFRAEKPLLSISVPGTHGDRKYNYRVVIGHAWMHRHARILRRVYSCASTEWRVLPLISIFYTMNLLFADTTNFNLSLKPYSGYHHKSTKLWKYNRE